MITWITGIIFLVPTAIIVLMLVSLLIVDWIEKFVDFMAKHSNRTGIATKTIAVVLFLLYSSCSAYWLVTMMLKLAR